jgi:SAM-dependent methyltransferase
MTVAMEQDTQAEINFFTTYAEQGEYDVLTERTSKDIIARCVELGGWHTDMSIVDLGCGSGGLTRFLRQRGLRTVGIDICAPLVAIGHRTHDLALVVGDVQNVPLADASCDGVLLSGLIHHFPNPEPLLREVYRILKPGGSFASFDPNGRNPFMWLYRDHASPLYSARGVTPNERPIDGRRIAERARVLGFHMTMSYCSVGFTYVESSALRWLLPMYNWCESLLFSPTWLASRRAFVLMSGVKHA